MKIGETTIEDTFAEAFGMRYLRLIVTAHDEYWLNAATQEFCGYSASVIACDAETGVERPLSPDETPDGRVGAAILVFGFSGKRARQSGCQSGRAMPDDLRDDRRVRRLAASRKPHPVR